MKLILVQMSSTQQHHDHSSIFSSRIIFGLFNSERLNYIHQMNNNIFLFEHGEG